MGGMPSGRIPFGPYLGCRFLQTNEHNKLSSAEKFIDHLPLLEILLFSYWMENLNI